MSSRNTTASLGASGGASAVPIIISFAPSLTPVADHSASSRSMPPLTPMIFCLAGGTPVSAKSWAFRTEGGCEVSTSTSWDSFCHLTVT